MDLNEEKNKKILIFVLIIALLILGIYKIFFEHKSVKKEKIDTETISIVKKPNDFYTVSSCVSRYLRYLSDNDTDNLLILLSDEYKKQNSINKDNLYTFISYYDRSYEFNPRKMYVQRVSKNVYKYYVYGLIEEELMDMDSQEMDYYLIIILDKENMTFAVEPYNGDMFK